MAGRVSSTSASTLGSGVSSPTIQNITVTAGTEETVAIPLGSRRYLIRDRNCQGFQVRYAAAATNYYTVDCGNDYRENGLAPTTTYIVYITPDEDGVLEVLSWS